MKTMDAVSRLNPGALPFLPAGYHLFPTPAAVTPSPEFLYPQPPHQLLPAYGWPAAFGGSCCPSGGCKVGASSFLLQAAYPLLVPPAPRCHITEIFVDGGEAAAKVEVRDEPSSRSVLATWSREPTSPREPRLPPPPPTSFVRKVLPRPRRWPRLAFNPSSNITSLMIRNIPNKFM
jgi:hypothetical protein